MIGRIEFGTEEKEEEEWKKEKGMAWISSKERENIEVRAAKERWDVSKWGCTKHNMLPCHKATSIQSLSLLNFPLYIFIKSNYCFLKPQISIVTATCNLISRPHICLWRWKTKPPLPRPDSRRSLGSEGFATTSKPRSPSHVSMHASVLINSLVYSKN